MKVQTDRARAGALTLAVAAGLMVAGLNSDASACGYDDPQSMSRGLLNWTYPDSLYVIGAISREVAARRLPLANFDQAGPDLFGRRFRQTKEALEQFGEMLRMASPEPSQAPVTMVLVEPMLWTRFEPGPDGLHARVHVSGHKRGDLVVVTGEAVIGQIVAGRLTMDEAGERGLVRLYGSEDLKAEFIGTYQQVGSEAFAAASRNRAPSKSNDRPQQSVTTALH